MIKCPLNADAPAAIGPYTQAFQASGLLFVSGCIPLDPKTAQVVSGGIEEQTEQALMNLKAVVEAGGSELGKVVKTLVRFHSHISFPILTCGLHLCPQVFIKNMDDFATVNAIYGKFFGDHKPARSAVEVACLPKDVLFEIECIARYVHDTPELRCELTSGTSAQLVELGDRESIA